MPTLEELFAQVDAQREEIIALEQALVRIPSVNTGFMPTGDETPVCEYIRDWLAEDGIRIRNPWTHSRARQHPRPHRRQQLRCRPHVHVPHRCRPGRRGREVAIPTLQRDHRRRTHLWARRIRLQGSTYRPVVCHAPPHSKRNPARRQPDLLLRRRRRARRSLRLRMARGKPP